MSVHKVLKAKIGVSIETLTWKKTALKRSLRSIWTSSQMSELTTLNENFSSGFRYSPIVPFCVGFTSFKVSFELYSSEIFTEFIPEKIGYFSREKQSRAFM